MNHWYLIGDITKIPDNLLERAMIHVTHTGVPQKVHAHKFKEECNDEGCVVLRLKDGRLEVEA